jgi:hypothetical protein
MPGTTEKIFSQFDESFRPGEPQRYSFVAEIEKNKFNFTVREVEKNKFLGAGSLHHPFEESVRTTEWIKNSFHSRRIIIANQRSTLIPAVLFSEAEKYDYLDFNMERAEDDVVLYDWLENLGIYNVFSIPGRLQKEIKSIFPDARVCHVSSILMETLYLNYKNLMGTGKVFLNVRDEEFDLTIFNGKQLRYFNSFPFKVADDLVYYLIFVMEQMNLNPEETPLILMGAAEKKSTLFEMLFRYIRNIEFATRNDSFDYSYVLNDIPGHFYYTLFNSEQCEL